MLNKALNKTRSMLFLMALFSSIILAQPAQAGWLDWLGLGDETQSENKNGEDQQDPATEPSTPPAVRDEVLPEWADFSKNEIEFVIKINALNGEQEGRVNWCETRRTEARACSMVGTVPRSFAKGPQSIPNKVYDHRTIRVGLKRFAGDDNMVQLWLHGDSDTGMMDKYLDASVAQLVEGLTIPVSEERGYGSRTPDIPSVPSGTVFLKIRKPAQSSGQ